MNTALISSLLKKALPLVVGYAVAKGWIASAVADTLPDMLVTVVDALVLIVSTIPTILASIKSHPKPQ